MCLHMVWKGLLLYVCMYKCMYGSHIYSATNSEFLSSGKGNSTSGWTVSARREGCAKSSAPSRLTLSASASMVPYSWSLRYVGRFVCT
jgi:hypothetical protein